MYGSQFNFEQSMKGHQDRQYDFRINLTNKKINKPKLTFWLSIILVSVSISSMSFAGPKDSKLAGGNGNAQGR